MADLAGRGPEEVVLLHHYNPREPRMFGLESSPYHRSRAMGRHGLSDELTIKVKVEQLRKQMKANLKRHRATFEEAIIGYRQKAIEELERTLVAIKTNSKAKVFVNLEMPQDHSESYETALSMLDWTTEEEIELTQEQFRAYVNDDWGWQRSFITTTGMYGATGATGPAAID